MPGGAVSGLARFAAAERIDMHERSHGSGATYPQRVQSSDKKVTVVVVDDHPFFRDGVTRGLTNSGLITVVGEAGTGREGLAVIAAEKPDVALVDYQMPDLDGLDVVHAVVRDKLPTRVLLLSAITDSAIVFRALEEGAAGYLSKDARRAEIVDAVLSVAAGRTVVPPDTRRRAGQRDQAPCADRPGRC